MAPDQPLKALAAIAAILRKADGSGSFLCQCTTQHIEQKVLCPACLALSMARETLKEAEAEPPGRHVVQFFTISQYGTPRRFIKDEPFKTEVSRLLGTKSVTVSDMNHIRALFAVAGVELKFKEVPAYEGIPA